MRQLLRKLRGHENEPTAIECGLVAAAIAIAGTAAVDSVGSRLNGPSQSPAVASLDGKALAAR